MVFTAVEVIQHPTGTAAAAEPQPAKIDARPDIVSAGVSARAQGSRVEVTSLQTAESSTFVNPDSSLTTDLHAAPIRYRDSSGRWQDVDLSLVKTTDDVVSPRGHQHGLRFGGRTANPGGVLATATAGAGRQVEWIAPWSLPEPTIDGTKATYADVQRPGVNMVLDARRSGFELDFVLTQRPASAPVWRIPLRTRSLTARQRADGSIDFVDAQGLARSTIPVPYMWDAVVDERSGLPVNTAKVDISLEQVSAGRATLVIAPDPAWVMDSSRVAPITVDPTYATATTGAAFDTWVQSDVTTDQSASAELRVGSWDSGATKTRSFLNFATSTFSGKQILGATLSLFESYSHTCTPSTFLVKSATPASTSTRWTSQPTIGGQYGSANIAKGNSASCPAGRVEVPITGLVDAWSTATYPTGGMALVAQNETDSNGWKRFHSTEGAGDPFISFTWNRKPATPATPSFASAVAYAPPGGSSVLYTPYLKPWTQTKGTDADGNNVRYIFEFHTSTAGTSSTLVTTCGSSPGVPSGTTDGCLPNVDLPDNTAIYIRAKTTDGWLESGWSGWQQVRVGTQTPAAPNISCPSPYVINSWQDTAPTSDVVCTITATGTGYSAPGYVRVEVDGKKYPTNFTGGAPGQIKITPSSDPAIAKTTVTIPKGVAGLHRITAQAESPAGKLSGATGYSFGWGSASMTQPTVAPRVTTTGGVKIEASGPPKGASETVPTASLRWRVSGYSTAHETIGWNTTTTTPLTVTDNGTAGISVAGLWDTTTATEDANLDSDPNTAGVQPTKLNDRLPVLLDVQVCLTYASSTQCTWSQSKTTVQRVPHAFGDDFPIAIVPAGEVALWTGEFHHTTVDISAPGYTGNLIVSRSHSTYAGATDTINGVFGPGWTAHFDGTGVGAGGMDVVDNTRLDGTIALVRGDGTPLVWSAPNGERRTTADYVTGTWVPADEDTELDGSKLTVAGTGTSTTISYVEDDGTVTTFTPAAAPTASTDTLFRAADIAVPGVTGKTTYSYDGSGRVSRILAPVPPGVACPATGALNPGCRALRFDYGTTGDANGRLVAASLDIYNPAKMGGAGMDSIKVAEYTYGTGGVLSKVTDARSGLGTEYGYNTLNHLTSVKPAGQVPYQLVYTPSGDTEKLSEVRRDRPVGDPAGGTAQVARVIYDVPLSGVGLPDLTATSVGRWGQKVAPVKGFAVFGPDRPLTAAPGEADWAYANLQYTDANGYTVNTADHGAGAWQYTAADYNDQGNMIRELDERAIRLIIDGQVPAGASADQLATLTVYNSDIVDDTGKVVTPAGTLMTDVYGPARFATLKNGTIAWVRPHERVEFDGNAPNGGINPDTSLPYRLLTNETVAAHDPGTGQDVEATSRTLTDYSAPVAGDPDGWAARRPGKTITDLDLDGTTSAGDVIRVTRYDSEGRVVEVRQPESNGSDAGTMKTVYYAAATNTSFPECGAKPHWAGMLCKSYPAAQPSKADGTLTPTLPSSMMSGYSYLLRPTNGVETSGSVTRTRTTTYLADGRTESFKIVVTGLPGSTPNPDKTYTYDQTTGLPTVITATAADGTASSITTGYDGWGRKVSYQPTGQQATTTTYNAAGDVSTVSDQNGVTTHTYDGTDAVGRAEHRGLVTRVDVTTSGTTWSSSAAYDAAGNVTTQKLPGNVTRTDELDNAGQLVGLRYTGQVTTANADGTTTVEPNGGWLSWSRENHITGQTTHEWTPDGAAFTGATNDAPGDARPYDRAYVYDAAGDLIQARDRTAPTGTDIVANADSQPCETRRYTYDRNGNRVSTSTATVTSGPCPTSGGSVKTNSFDTADRPATHTYDPLGRATSIPAGDTPIGSQELTLGYYDNDGLRSQSHGTSTTTYLLDAVDRPSIEQLTAPIDGQNQTTTMSNFYNDESDNPAWVVDGPKMQRYVTLTSSGLTFTAGTDGASIIVVDPHGDTVTTVQVSAQTTPATAMSGWNSYDEYGQPASGNSASTGLTKYQWLGGSMRATTGSGLLKMGARVYNPATGTFTSMDPIIGGNVNAYTYPGDPINTFDITGKSKKFTQQIRSTFKRYVKMLNRARGFLYTPPTNIASWWDCFWACAEMIAAFVLVTISLATFGLVPAPFNAWGLVASVVLWLKTINEVENECPPRRYGGKD